MPNTLRIKRRATGANGAPSSLANAELAFNEVDNTLYYGKGTGGAGGTATTVDAIGGSGAFATLTTAQTISGAKTFSALPAVSASLSASDNSTNVATTSFVKAQNYLTSGSSITSAASQDATIGGTIGAVTVALKSVGTAGTYTKVTTDAQGRVSSGTTLAASDIPTLTSSKISDFDTQVRTSRLDQMAAPTGAVSMNSQQIIWLAEPQFSSSAATKNYVDSVAQGLNAKQSVKAATTANITLSGTQTIDGVAVASDERVLVKNQTSAYDNGIYLVSPGSWVRAYDANAWNELRSAFVFVEQGTVNGDTGWTCTADAGGTLGSTSLNWVQFSGAGTYLAGTGLSLSGNTFNVVNGVYTTGDQTIGGNKTFSGALYSTNGFAEFGLSNLSDRFQFKNTSTGNVVGGFLPSSGRLIFFTGTGAANGFTFNTSSTSNAFLLNNDGSASVAAGFTATQFNGSGAGLTSSTVPIASLVAGDYSSKITSGTYSINVSGNAATVSNGVYTNVGYVDPSWISSLAKSKVGLGNVENTALSTWAGSANITTVGTLSSGTVPTSLLSGDLDGGTF